MRIKCNSEDCQAKDGSYEAVDYQTLGISRMRNQNISTEIIGDLEPGVTPFISTFEPKMSSYMPKEKIPKQGFTDDSQLDVKAFKPASLEFKRNYSQPVIRKSSLDMAGEYARDTAENQRAVRFYNPTDSSSNDEVDGNFIGGKVILGEFGKKDAIKNTLLKFKDLSYKINNNNNNNNNSDNTIDTNQKNNDKDLHDGMIGESTPKGKPYALATLDGTIMLVQDEVILW